LAQAGVDAALAAVAPGAADPRVATVPCPMVWKGGLTPGLTIRGYDANDPTTLQTFRTAAPVAALGDIRAGGWLNFLPSDKDLGFIRYLGDGFRADGTPVRTVYFPIDEVLTAANQPR
ncbi:MAG: hypothetical protein KC620_14510, partial [Myxococcales bacterium]|nr:hypothetical protein [Myxococcales bacterium]